METERQKSEVKQNQNEAKQAKRNKKCEEKIAEKIYLEAIYKFEAILSDFLKQKNCHFISKAKSVKPNNVENPIWKRNKK
jgi:hypothetical protein